MALDTERLANYYADLKRRARPLSEYEKDAEQWDDEHGYELDEYSTKVLAIYMAEQDGWGLLEDEVAVYEFLREWERPGEPEADGAEGEAEPMPANADEEIPAEEAEASGDGIAQD